MREHQTDTWAGHGRVADVFKGSAFCEASDSPFFLFLLSTALLKAPLRAKGFMSSHTNWWYVYVFPFVCTIMKGSPDTAD